MKVTDSIDATQGKFEWQVPNLATDSLVIKLSDTNDNSQFDILSFPLSIRRSLAISNVIPESGIPGTLVKIYGAGFNNENNQLKFLLGDNELNLEYISENFVEAKIPGESYGLNELAVTTGNDSAFYQGRFTTLKKISGELFYSDPKFMNFSFGSAPIVSDIDGDGDKDFIFHLGASNDYKLAWIENLGDTLARLEIITDDVNTIHANRTRTFQVTDIDNDKDGDIVYYDYRYGKLFFIEYLGNKNFSEKKVVVDLPFFSGDRLEINSILCEDLDGDIDKDILITSYEENSIFWIENIGNGIFSEIIKIDERIYGLHGVHPHDFDLDGDFDLVVYSRELRLYENFGNGKFSRLEDVHQFPSRYNDQRNIFLFSSNDIDNDGDLDLFFFSNYVDSKYWYENIEDSSFVTHRFSEELQSKEIYNFDLRDLNTDGYPDLVFIDQVTRTLNWCENFGNGEFSGIRKIYEKLGFDWFNISDIDGDGDEDAICVINAGLYYCENNSSTVTAVNDGNATNYLPTKNKLYQNFPNPFNPSTMIEYDVKEHSHVKIKIYSILGEEIKTVLNENKSPGSYSVKFDASHLPSGIYFYEIKTKDFIDIKKMLLVK